jgi:hypothetical protein
MTINTRFPEMSSAPGTENAIGTVERSREFSPATEAKEFERGYPAGISGGAPPSVQGSTFKLYKSAVKAEFL